MIVTEAASINYVVTPIISAMAEAKVYAITSDSQYGNGKYIEELTYNFAEFCGMKDKIEVIFEKKKSVIKQANIITNLGFVKPIDKNFIEMMNEKALISYMYEVWEYRDGDVDIQACNNNNIPILATNEDHLGLEVLDFCGNLCIKMLFELEIEVYKSEIVIVNKNIIIGDINAQISGKELIDLSIKIYIFQFAGDLDVEELIKYNIPYFPHRRIGKFKMGVTLANLGPKSVIDLHCAGLKVEEVMVRARLSGMSVEEAKMAVLEYSPGQILILD